MPEDLFDTVEPASVSQCGNARHVPLTAQSAACLVATRFIELSESHYTPSREQGGFRSKTIRTKPVAAGRCYGEYFRARHVMRDWLLLYRINVSGDHFPVD